MEVWWFSPKNLSEEIGIGRAHTKRAPSHTRMRTKPHSSAWVFPMMDSCLEKTMVMVQMESEVISGIY